MRLPADVAASIAAAAEPLIALLGPDSGDTLPVSPTQLRVLRLLRSRPDTTVNALAETLGVVPSSASRLCDRLEALGFVRRASDRRDRREVQLVVTPSAAALLDDLDARRRGALERVLAAMSPAARSDLVRSLSAFSAAARAVRPAESEQRTA